MHSMAYRESKGGCCRQQFGEQLAAEVDEFRGAPQEQQARSAAPIPIGRRSRNPSTHQRRRQSWIICSGICRRSAAHHLCKLTTMHIQKAQAQAEEQYNQHIATAQNYAQQYEQGVAQSLLVSEAAAAAPFPELASAPPEQRQAIMAHIARTDPQRFQEIKAHIAQVKELASNQIAEAQRIHQYQENQKQQQQEQTKQQFRQYAEYHDSGAAIHETPKVGRHPIPIISDGQKGGIG